MADNVIISRLHLAVIYNSKSNIFIITLSGLPFDSRRYQIFWVVVGLERGPPSLVRSIEELLEWKSSGSGPENRD